MSLAYYEHSLCATYGNVAKCLVFSISISRQINKENVALPPPPFFIKCDNCHTSWLFLKQNMFLPPIIRMGICVVTKPMQLTRGWAKFSHDYTLLAERNPPVPIGFPSQRQIKRQIMKSVDISLLSTWTSCSSKIKLAKLQGRIVHEWNMNIHVGPFFAFNIYTCFPIDKGTAAYPRIMTSSQL